MKKLLKISLFIIAIILLLLIIILEPCNYIPFSKCPKFYTTSNLSQPLKSNSEISKLLQLKIDSLVNKAIDDNDFLGVSVGIYKNQFCEIVSLAGLSNKLSLQKMDDNTLFRIASITKPMTATAILALQKESDFNLNDPIDDHLDYLSIDARITIEQLLNHTSGLPHYQSNVKSLSFKNYNSLIDASKIVEDLQLIGEPGEKYYYSGYGYLLLGALIEKKSNLSYTEFMKSNFWNRLNMNLTNTCANENTIESNLYLKYKSTFIKSPKDNLSSKLAGGGILSTSHDMLQFSKSIIEGEIFDSSTINAMFSKRFDSGNSDYIYGWHTDTTNYGRVLYHGGALSGASGYLRIYIDQGLAIICLSNSAFSNQEVRYLSRNMSKFFLEENGLDIKISQIKNTTSQIEGWW